MNRFTRMPVRRRRGFAVRSPFALFAGLAAAWLAACGDADGMRRVRGVEWDGRPLPLASHLANPSGDALRAAGLRLLPYPPRNLYAAPPGEWGDSLRLLEFGDELEAYAAFQEIAGDPGDVSAGITVLEGRVGFRRGRWIGLLDAWSWKGAAWHDTALALPGAAPSGSLPAAFGAMLHQGRIPGSERILTRDLLGAGIAPALAVAMDCHGDTAWLYAAPHGGSGSPSRYPQAWEGWRADSAANGMFSREGRDLPPARLLVSAQGIVAVEGCFDENLTNNWIKRQKSSIKVIKKSLNTLKP